MSVFSKILFVGAVLAGVAGWLVGFQLNLTNYGRSTAWETTHMRLVLTQAIGDEARMWMTVSWVLIAVGALMLVLAVVAALMSLSDQNAKLKAAAKAA